MSVLDLMSGEGDLVGFFIRMANFTKYCSDEVLPHMLAKSPEKITPDVVDICDELVLSLRTFIQMSRFMSKEPKRDNHALQQNGWKKMITTIINRIGSDRYDKSGAPYYCGLCDAVAESPSDWIGHKRDKVHTEKTSQTLIKVMPCDVCGITCLSEGAHLSQIFQSAEHQRLDQVVRQAAERNHSKSQVPKKVNSVRRPDSAMSCESQRRPSPPINKPPPPATSKTSKPKKEAFSGHRTYDSDILFQGAYICQTFVKETDHVKNSGGEPCSISFCRPCNYAYVGDKAWQGHLKSKQHITFMSDKRFVNFDATCALCSFHMVSSKKIAVVYMKYHLAEVHPKSYKSKELGDVVTMTQHELPSVSSSRRTSLDGGSQQGYNRQNSKEDLLTGSPPENWPESLDDCDTDSQITDLFSALLKEKKSQFQREQLKTFNGLCLECSTDFSDQFKWMDHNDLVHPKKSKNTGEVVCEDCCFYLYGDLSVINELFQEDNHLELDRIMSKI